MKTFFAGVVATLVTMSILTAVFFWCVEASIVWGGNTQ